MAQQSISSFFITRKRGIEDDVIASKKKVICLERTRNSSESQDSHAEDSEELGAKVVFSKALDNTCTDDEPKKMVVKKPTVRQGITPQRTTRSRKVHMQEVDGIEAPKIVNFFKAGNLSPQKKAKGILASQPPKLTDNEVTFKAGFSTPTKTKPVGGDSIEKTTLVASNGLKADEIKKKLKGSSRLAELKTSINKLQNGLDKLDQMEKKRLASGPLKAKATAPVSEVSKTLKPFKSIELEIMR
jgi:chromatin licensing and DNA replication factor 1